MKIHGIAATGLAWAMALAGGAPAWADAPPAGQTPAPVTAPLLVPADFAVPTSAAGDGFQLVPLGPDVVKVDFDAYMSSIEHLQKTFSRSDRWPHPGISAEEAMQDMENELGRFRARKSFAFSILTPDGTRERGSLYVSPSPVPGYDAVVRLWVTRADYDAGFDAAAYAWAQGWIAASAPPPRNDEE